MSLVVFLCIYCPVHNSSTIQIHSSIHWTSFTDAVATKFCSTHHRIHTPGEPPLSSQSLVQRLPLPNMNFIGKIRFRDKIVRLLLAKHGPTYSHAEQSVEVWTGPEMTRTTVRFILVVVVSIFPIRTNFTDLHWLGGPIQVCLVDGSYRFYSAEPQQSGAFDARSLSAVFLWIRESFLKRNSYLVLCLKRWTWTQTQTEENRILPTEGFSMDNASSG